MHRKIYLSESIFAINLSKIKPTHNKYQMSPVDPSTRKPRKLYQPSPRRKSQYPGLKSKTESLESYRRDALHEYGRLKVNGTIPNHIVQVNYKTELSLEEIRGLWSKHSDRLRRAGIVARVAMEITRDEWRQRPVNKVHYHFVAKDDRSKDEMEELFKAVLMMEMEQSAFKLHVFPFDEKYGWKGYIAYFVKLRNKDGKDPILFKKGLRMRKYFTINESKWWTYPDGTPRTMESIKEAMQRYKIAKKKLKMTEKFYEIKRQPARKETPTDVAELIAVLANETDETLYDWFAILLGKPTVFQTIPPKWLLDTIHWQPKKRFDLFNTIYIVLQDTDNPLIHFAFEIYFDCKIGQ